MPDKEPDDEEEDDVLSMDDDEVADALVIAHLWRTRSSQARALLGDSRLRTFLKEGLRFSDCAGFDLISEAFARGEGLDILTRGDAELGYVLRAESRGENAFVIEFSYRSEEGWNSGGEWLVSFDRGGTIEDIDLIAEWPDSV